MPGLGSASPEVKKEISKPLVRKRDTTVTFNPLKTESGGRKYSFFGESKCGKTISAITMGYMSRRYLPELRQEGFKYIPYAIETNRLPNIERIVFIDSEGTLPSQLDFPLERRVTEQLIKDLESNFLYVKISPASKHETIEEGKVKIDPESIEKLITAGERYVSAIDTAIDNYNDKNTLLILDSGTRLKWMLDQLADLIYRTKIATGESKGEPSVMAMEKYGPRNAEWLRITSALKQFKGTVIMTFMMTDTPQWVIEMAEKKGWKTVKPRKIETVEKGSEYTYDEEIMFDKDDDDKRFCIIKNYRGLQDAPFKPVFLNKKTKFSFLRCIEDMLAEEIGELPPSDVKV